MPLPRQQGKRNRIVMAMTRQTTAFLAASAAALCWGSATVMSKGVLDQVPPIPLLIIQLAASLTFLWTLILLRGVCIEAVADTMRIAWLGLLEPGLAFALTLVGLAHSKAGIATLIASLEAPVIALLSALLLRERISASFFALSIVILVGMALAIGLKDADLGNLIGDGLIALGTFVAALYVVLTSRVVTRRDPILVVACQQLAALLFALALLLVEVESR